MESQRVLEASQPRVCRNEVNKLCHMFVLVRRSIRTCFTRSLQILHSVWCMLVYSNSASIDQMQTGLASWPDGKTVNFLARKIHYAYDRVVIMYEFVNEWDTSPNVSSELWWCYLWRRWNDVISWENEIDIHWIEYARLIIITVHKSMISSKSTAACLSGRSLLMSRRSTMQWLFGELTPREEENKFIISEFFCGYMSLWKLVKNLKVYWKLY